MQRPITALRRWPPGAPGSTAIQRRRGQPGSGYFVDPVGSRRADGAERAEVLGERIEVDAPVQTRRRDRGEGAEIVAAVSQEAVDRHHVLHSRIERHAIELHVADADAGADTAHDRRLQVVGKAFRYAQVQEWPAARRRLALLFEHRDNLRTGHGEGEQRVIEGLERKCLAKGHDAVALLNHRVLDEIQVRAYATGIHEGDLRAEAQLLRLPQLRVRYQVARR